MTAALSGMAVLGAALLLSWAAKVAQLEISAALGVALLSLIAVLPQYSVDMYFAWQAGKNPAYTQYADANMTGANYLFIGLGWTTVVLLYCWKSRRNVLYFERKGLVELSALAMATVYCFLLPAKGHAFFARHGRPRRLCSWRRISTSCPCPTSGSLTRQVTRGCTAAVVSRGRHFRCTYCSNDRQLDVYPNAYLCPWLRGRAGAIAYRGQLLGCSLGTKQIRFLDNGLGRVCAVGGRGARGRCLFRSPFFGMDDAQLRLGRRFRAPQAPSRGLHPRRSGATARRVRMQGPRGGAGGARDGKSRVCICAFWAQAGRAS